MLATFSDHFRLFTSVSTSPWCGRSFKITASSASCIWSIFWKRVLICGAARLHRKAPRRQHTVEVISWNRNQGHQGNAVHQSVFSFHVFHLSRPGNSRYHWRSIDRRTASEETWATKNRAYIFEHLTRKRTGSRKEQKEESTLTSINWWFFDIFIGLNLRDVTSQILDRILQKFGASSGARLLKPCWCSDMPAALAVL